MLAGSNEKRRTTISVTELHKSLQSGKAPFIIDVRSAFEYSAGHIPGAVNIPFWATPFRHSQIKAASTDPLVLTCAHGPRAKMAKFFLVRAGFQHVMCLDGHMMAWKNAALPLE